MKEPVKVLNEGETNDAMRRGDQEKEMRQKEEKKKKKNCP